MKKHHLCKIICAVMLCALTLSALVGCSFQKEETVTVYPCYFNEDVAGMDAATMGAALKEAGWHLASTEQDASYDGATTHIYQITDGEKKKGIVIYEFATAEQAEQTYVADAIGTYFPSGLFPADHSLYRNYLRISNCFVMTMNNAHVDLMEILGLGTVSALEVPTENTQELRKNIKSVDIEAVKAEMEEEGYTFYQVDFLAQEDGEDFSPFYMIISPEQDRIYAYTQATEPKFGMSYTYYIYDLFERVAIDFNGEDSQVGIHFVGFKDGGCIMCYGGTFAEIEKYFAE